MGVYWRLAGGWNTHVSITNLQWSRHSVEYKDRSILFETHWTGIEDYLWFEWKTKKGGESRSMKRKWEFAYPCKGRSARFLGCCCKDGWKFPSPYWRWSQWVQACSAKEDIVCSHRRLPAFILTSSLHMVLPSAIFSRSLLLVPFQTFFLIITII